ncbi:MAG: hypothetical protein WCX79_04800 [Candidatus Paceibacterota bacterium]|jgi:hypothetical protein
MQDENSRLICETTGLLRELIVEQSKKIDTLHVNEQLVLGVTKDIADLNIRVGLLEEKVNQILLQFTEYYAATCAEKKFREKEEERNYQEHKSLLEKVWDNTSKLSGVAALIAILAQMIFK